MSASSQVAVLGPVRRERSDVGRSRSREDGARATLAAFALLGGYGVLRWATMLGTPPTGRLLGLIGLAVAIAALGRWAHDPNPQQRAAAIVAICLLALAVIPMSGFPLSWALHLRVARTATAIGNGLSALPGVIVPYRGDSRATSAVIVLGAGMLLLGAAFTLASSRRPLGEARLAGAALPLVVLAIVPSALARPEVAYVHGALLFLLLAAFVFSERLWGGGRGLRPAGLLLLPTIGALILSPAIEGSHPWISFEKIAGSLGSGVGETFNWSQTYGPLDWPQAGVTVLNVRASHPYYWKAEDLDVFDGQGWSSEPIASGNPLAGVTRSNQQRWTQTITMTLQGMSTSDVITAGTASPPTLPGGEPDEAGNGPGTYVAYPRLQPRDSYQFSAYTPRPTSSELAGSGTGYPMGGGLANELQMQLPAIPAPAPSATSNGGPAAEATIRTVRFGFYGSGNPPEGIGGLISGQALSALEGSPYGRVYALASRLAAGTTTPYAYVKAVMAYLARGYKYDQTPPLTRYPLLTFLFGNHLGYCQQFAGAMALLLRMGGIPARVAAGFATGDYDTADHAYVVTDIDAHAWVEAWFNGIGWVKFDPTPSSAPALGGNSAANPASSGIQPGHQPLRTTSTTSPTGAGASGPRRLRSAGSSGPWGTIALAVMLALLLAGGIAGLLRWGTAETPEQLLAELERAFRRCGRPLATAATLTTLEHRFSDTPEAAGYMRAIRDARYAAAFTPPTPAQRRAVRARLRRGLGPFAWLRALVALPPRPQRVRGRRAEPPASPWPPSGSGGDGPAAA